MKIILFVLTSCFISNSYALFNKDPVSFTRLANYQFGVSCLGARYMKFSHQFWASAVKECSRNTTDSTDGVVRLSDLVKQEFFEQLQEEENDEESDTFDDTNFSSFGITPRDHVDEVQPPSSVSSDGIDPYVVDQLGIGQLDGTSIFGRKKRSVRLDETSFLELLRRETHLIDRFLKYQCMLDLYGYLDSGESISKIFIRSTPMDSRLKEDLLEVFDKCQDYADCYAPLHEDDEVFHPELRRIYEMTRCIQRYARVQCVKHDYRKLVSETYLGSFPGPQLNDTKEEELEQIVDRMMDITMHSMEPDSMHLFFT